MMHPAFNPHVLRLPKTCRRPALGSGLAMVVMFGIAACHNTIEKTSGGPATSSLSQDILPGSNKAVLTLADGTAIMLDSAVNGPLARQGYSKIIKQANGSVEYITDRPAAGMTKPSAATNTLRTPNGGQYQLTLPDGTKVWLNAASSITYPAVFTGPNRMVKMTGEAYFDVAVNADKPFIVKTWRDIVKVLGTEFNVNSYTDELTIKTSLAHGSVAVNDNHLTPGMAYANGLVFAVNADHDAAWKNGFFDFSDLTMEQAMRQISRWYNVEIVFDNGVSTGRLFVEIRRELRLKQLMKALEGKVAHFKLEGNVLHVSRLK